MKNKNRNKSRLLFTDTESLLYEIETVNLYEYFSKNKKMSDFSNYFSKSKYQDHSTALVVGKMKDEVSDIVVEEYVE